MKATEAFTLTIAAYIEKEKQADKLFAKCVDSQPSKTIEGCVNYILKEVQKSQVIGNIFDNPEMIEKDKED